MGRGHPGHPPRSANANYRPQRKVVAKVMFLLVSVILLRGGGVSEADPPGADTPPREQTQTPGGHTPRGADTPLALSTPPGSRLWHTVNERSVRILLECILVLMYFSQGTQSAIWQELLSDSTTLPPSSRPNVSRFYAKHRVEL